MTEIQIVEVTTQNYSEYLDMIQWRITGKPAKELRLEGTLKPYTEETLANGQCLDTNYFWVYAAKIKGEMVGYLQGALIPKPDNRKGTFFVDEVWTQESFRGQGIAKALIARAIKKAREIDMWEIRLTVDIDNPAARKVYTGAGFEEKECIFGRIRL